MSLSDYIKYLRALKGGLTPWEIAEGSGVPAREIHLMEVKHRRVGEDDVELERLAQFFGVSKETLVLKRDAYRKRLTSFLEEEQAQSKAVILKLDDGEEISGKIDWFGREALALRPADDLNSPYIVQRGWVADWRDAEKSEWEVGQQA